MKRKLVLLALPAMAIGALTGCGAKYDVKLLVYNWADYIYDGTDDDGNIVDKSTIKRFEEYYHEKYGKTIKVDYRTFSTPEEMYSQIKAGSIAPDLICPSDYMIQKMANEDMLEEFSYDDAKDKYGESLSNWDEFGSPFIRNRFKSSTLNNGKSFLQYAVPYFWGTMGFTYNPEYFTAEEVGTWECLWSKEAKFQGKFSLKDSMRDTYVAAIFHVYHDDIVALDKTAENYNELLSEYFNKCDDTTIKAVEAALKEAKKTTVCRFEVDEGKDEIVKGNYQANLAWSGDSVYSMDSAQEDNDMRLNYSLPEEGSNVWFDGWCMPKGAQKEVSEEFVNFLCDPSIAALNMDSVGYTSPIVGDDIWEMINEWYAAEDDEEAYEVDLSFYFGDSIEDDGKIRIPVSEKGRQFDAQYPTEETLKKCCIMKDFGTQTKAVEEMWLRVKSYN